MIERIKKLFGRKKVNLSIYNIHHPDLEGKVEFAFECGGIKYYRAVKDYILPVGRYKWIDATLNEVDIRMTLPLLKEYVKRLKKYLDGSQGIVNLVEASKIIYSMETRCDLAFEPETVKRLASVVYFDETEDITDFDQEYASKKIKLWEKHDYVGFFLTKPIAELLNLTDISEISLRNYIQKAEQILKYLTSGLENPSSES